jgi:hypothetical protein
MAYVGAMRLRCSSHLRCPPGRLSEELARPALFLHVTAPLLVFQPVEPTSLPPRWTPGVFRFRLRVGGRLPLGEHTVDAREVHTFRADSTEPQRVWHDAGYSGLIRSWDHKIIIEAVDGGTRYADEVDIHAGPLTVPAWLFANVFYRHRQRRLAALVANGFDY